MFFALILTSFRKNKSISASLRSSRLARRLYGSTAAVPPVNVDSPAELKPMASSLSSADIQQHQLSQLRSRARLKASLTALRRKRKIKRISRIRYTAIPRKCRQQSTSHLAPEFTVVECDGKTGSGIKLEILGNGKCPPKKRNTNEAIV